MFGATIWEVMRIPLKENLNYLDEHRTIAHLSEMLTNYDYIIDVLPSTSSTLEEPLPKESKLWTLTQVITYIH